MWMVRRSTTARPGTDPRSIARFRVGGDAIWPREATSRMDSSCTWKILASAAPHNRAAFSATASRTGWRSVGELEITRRISAVAVCCSRASVRSAFLVCSSVSSRAFSMAMAAWSAKVFISAI